MGLLSNLLKPKSNSGGTIGLGSGNHQINHSDIISGGAMNRLSPENNPNWSGIQSVPTVTSPRYMTPEESEALTQYRKELAIKKKASRKGYEELKRIDRYDTKAVGYWQGYAKENAKQGLKQTRKLASVGRRLHSLRPGYAGVMNSLDKADNSAQQQIEAIANQLKQ